MLSGSECVKISVVMSVYNGEKYLREAIESILNQTFTDFEFIIIDDGSSDGSIRIIKSYNDGRIRLIEQENCGLAASLNRGVSLARAAYIARMDQDDNSLPERFEKQYKYLQKHGDVIALGTAADWVDEKGMYVCTRISPCTDSEIKKRIPETPFHHPTVIFTKKAFEEVGGYPEKFKYAPEDTVFFNNLYKIGKLANIPDVLLKYRLSPSSLNGRNMLNSKLVYQAVEKEMNGEELTTCEYKELENVALKITPAMKNAGYYALLSRLYLLDVYTPQKVRLFALKSISFYPWRVRAYLLLGLSFFPKRAIDFLYKLKE